MGGAARPLRTELSGDRLGRARLASPLDHAKGREAWFPADLSWKGAERVARPRTSRGRRSMQDHAGWPGLIRIPAAGCGVTPAGSEVEVLTDEVGCR